MTRLRVSLASSVLLALVGLVLIPREPRLALTVVVFFGSAAAVFFFQLRQRLRFDSPDELVVRLDEWMVASKTQPLLASLFFIAIGALPWVLPEVFDDAPGERYFYMAGGALGVFGLVATLLGWRGTAAIRFTAEGFELRGETACLFHFDNIETLGEGEVGGQIALLLTPRELSRLMRTVPAQKRLKVARAFASSQSMFGAPVVVLPSRFGLDAGALFVALSKRKR